jgi:hypothetical protein
MCVSYERAARGVGGFCVDGSGRVGLTRKRHLVAPPRIRGFLTFGAPAAPLRGAYPAFCGHARPALDQYT